MKKLNNPFFLTIAGLAFFALAFIDALMNDAQGWSDMSFIGKTFIFLSMAILAYLVSRYWVGWLWHQVKKINRAVTKKK